MTPTIGRPPAGSPLRRRLLAAAAALAVAGLATVATVAGTAADASAPHEGTRSQIPWSKVGPGWQLATWARTTTSRTTLYVVAPDGHRWSVAHLGAHVEPQLWSPDHRRAVVRGLTGYAEVDLHTGRSHVVRLPEDAWIVSYSRPKGLALLAQVGVTSGKNYVDRLERFDERGRHQQTYPSTVKGAGALSTSAAVETPDGGQVVVGAAHGLVVLRNNGSVVRRLGTKLGSCSTSSWWRTGVALATCGYRMWAVPLSGAAPQALTRGTTKQNPWGYDDVWRYSKGRLGLAPNGCGPESLVRFDKAGNGVRFAVPSLDKHPVTIVHVGHHGDVVDVLARRAGCQSGVASLLAYNAVTHHSKALLGPGANGGTVVNAVPYPAR